ncbi:MAG TPA: polysaccharide deacetylase family protein [Candidatus Polarisedimenticolia bacterium]|nr:polysaccharide deacetylase family protein [Candidatus Polarisedimenticolia bacterium]
MALLKDKIGSAEVWRAGFSLDRLAPAHLIEIVAAIAADVRPVLKPPLPEGRQAVVMLIHDVEEALPDDPRGLLSVRRGTEACLEAEARQGFRATYNLVGDFGPMIGDLGRRMVAEGHEVASHGLSHRVMADLSEADVRSEVKGSEDRIRGITGIEIQGFRSPRSRWSGSLLKVLSEKGYLWNAEADDSPYPYPIPLDDAGRVIRLPVAADDWDFVKRNASPRAVLKLWQREVRSAMERGAWIALGSHPSVLGVHPERTETFRDFLAWLADQEVKIMTAGEGAAWWRSRTWDQNSATSFPRNQIRANRE